MMAAALIIRDGKIWCVDDDGRPNPPNTEIEPDESPVSAAAEIALLDAGVDGMIWSDAGEAQGIRFFSCEIDGDPSGGDAFKVGWLAPEETRLGKIWMGIHKGDMSEEKPRIPRDIRMPAGKTVIDRSDEYEIVRALECSNKVIRISSIVK